MMPNKIMAIAFIIVLLVFVLLIGYTTCACGCGSGCSGSFANMSGCTPYELNCCQSSFDSCTSGS